MRCEHRGSCPRITIVCVPSLSLETLENATGSDAAMHRNSVRRVQAYCRMQIAAPPSILVPMGRCGRFTRSQSVIRFWLIWRSIMSSYPEPPKFANYPIAPLEQATELAGNSSTVAPELPSKMWPFLIGFSAVVALGLQTWALLGLLEAGKHKSEFNAKVTAWESANQNRQEAIDTWTSIEQHVNANVEGLREQASLLQGTVDSLQKQRDQLVQTTTTQAKTLESLQSTREGLQTEISELTTELETINARKQSAEVAANSADALKVQYEGSNQQLIERGRQIKAALAKLETESAEAEGKVETQTKLLNKSQQELAAMEARVSQYDAFLQKRLAGVAEFKLQEAKSSQLALELKDAEEKLALQRAEIAKSTNELDALKKQASDAAIDRDGKQGDVAKAQADLKRAEEELAALRKNEQELVARITTMSKSITSVTAEATTSLTEMTGTAAETIKEMAQKAKEVRDAVRAINVPLLPNTDESATPNEPEVASEPGADEGGDE